MARGSIAAKWDRRQFLSRVACGAAAVASPEWLGSAAAGNPSAWTMRLSASSIAFSKLPIEEACERIAKLGFEAVDIWSAHAGCPHLDDVQKRLGGEGLKDLLAKHRLKLAAFTVYQGGYPRYAELLRDVGGGLAIRGCHFGDEKQVAAKMKGFLKGLAPQIDLAEKHNCRLAIENHGGTLLNSLDSFKAFVEADPNPRVGIALAPYHLQAGKISVEEAIGVVGKRLMFFYAWQNGGGKSQLPGLTSADCTPWIRALAKANYGGCVNPFMHGDMKPDEMATSLAKSRDYLKQCCAEAV